MQDVLCTAGEVRANLEMTFPYGIPHMDTLVLADQQKPYIHLLCTDTGCHQEDLLRAKAIRDRWRESVLSACFDDDDDDDDLLLIS